MSSFEEFMEEIKKEAETGSKKDELASFTHHFQEVRESIESNKWINGASTKPGIAWWDSGYDLISNKEFPWCQGCEKYSIEINARNK